LKLVRQLVQKLHFSAKSRQLEELSHQQ
jgi:hypothetical protein